jgi:hypothetical protein
LGAYDAEFFLPEERELTIRLFREYKRSCKAVAVPTLRHTP